MIRKKVPLPPESDTAKLLGPKQAAEFLGTSTKRIHDLRRRGEIPAVRLGWRSWGFRQDDLTAYVTKAAPKEAAGAEGGSAPKLKAKSSLNDVMKSTTEMGPPPKIEAKALAEEAPVVRMANAIIATAIDHGASDIHIEPNPRNVRVRVRIDGRMVQIMSLPKHIQAPVLNRYKVMADIPSFQRHLPHTGQIWIRHNSDNYNLRVSAIPSASGETLVIHILDSNGAERRLESLGFPPEIQVQSQSLILSCKGLLLIAAPPGNGATTTAHCLLNTLNQVEKNIHTLEETLEYRQTDLIQTALASDRRLVPREWLEAALHQNPDFLFLGDIRDKESAALAVDAALTGVTTLATISAGSAVDAIRRLNDFGIPQEQMARCLSGILAQRLARRLCPDCKEAYEIPEKNLWELGSDPNSDKTVTLYRGKGCDTCKGHGIKGSIGVFELFQTNWEIIELLRRGAGPGDLFEAARANGLTTLRADAFQKMLDGIIAPEEVQKVPKSLYGQGLFRQVV